MDSSCPARYDSQKALPRPAKRAGGRLTSEVRADYVGLLRPFPRTIDTSKEVMKLGWLDNGRKGTSKSTGMTNNARVTCSHCRTPQYLKIGNGGSWKCGYCKKTNGGR